MDINLKGSWDWVENQLQRNLGLKELVLGINQCQDDKNGWYMDSQSNWEDCAKEYMCFGNHCVGR